MSNYYTPKRVNNLYQPGRTAPYPLSRSKIELFMECPRCFYLDRRLGIARPPGFPFSLNAAVDKLMKKEFDIHRVAHKTHPLMERYGIKAIPLENAQLEDWRNNFKGIRYHHSATNLTLFGAIDDVWQNEAGEYLIVDYKATSKNEKIESLNKKWQDSYKRQMEIYQWLFRQNGYPVSDTGYFVYCNGITDNEAFDAKLEFDLTIIPYQGDSSWLEPKIKEIYDCLESDDIPAPSLDCDYCRYRAEVRKEGDY